MQHRPSRRVSVPALIVFCLLALALVVLVAVRAVSVNNAESAETLDLAQFDAIADCIDTVKAKVTLVCRAKEAGVYAISAMGAGNKLDPTRFQVADIAKTSVCPLCRVMRVQLKKRGVAHHTVVYSTEEPLKVVADESNGRHAPGSVSFVPPVVGLIMAGEIIKTIAKGEA